MFTFLSPFRCQSKLEPNTDSKRLGTFSSLYSTLFNIMEIKSIVMVKCQSFIIMHLIFSLF